MEPNEPEQGGKKGLSKSLRERAEALMGTSREQISNMPFEEIQSLVHELHVHQIELEIQNEELRQAQVELSESRDRYSDLYDFAPVGYLTLELDGNVIEANLTITTMLGITRQDLTGSNITRFVASDDQDKFYVHRQSVLSKVSIQNCELKMQDADGRPFDVRIESMAYDGRGKQPHCRCALIDISAEKEAAALAHQAERNKRTLETLPMGAVHVDGERIYLNRKAENITGYSREELPTQSQWFQKLYREREAENRAAYEAHCKIGELAPFKTVIRCCDGEEKLVELTAHCFSDYEVWFLNDLTT